MLKKKEVILKVNQVLTRSTNVVMCVVILTKYVVILCMRPTCVHHIPEVHKLMDKCWDPPSNACIVGNLLSNEKNLNTFRALISEITPALPTELSHYLVVGVNQ